MKNGTSGEEVNEADDPLEEYKKYRERVKKMTGKLNNIRELITKINNIQNCPIEELSDIVSE